VAQSESSYREQLGAVLRRRDPTGLQQFLIQSAERFGDDRQVAEVRDKTSDQVEELMHRMILARPDLGDLHRASREWLSQRGIDSQPASDGNRATRSSPHAPRRR
jgi:hypothetical protein